MTPAQTALASQILCEHFGREPSEITDGASLVHDFGADSLDSLEVRMSLEEAFNIEIADLEIDGVVTVGDVFALLGRKL